MIKYPVILLLIACNFSIFGQTDVKEKLEARKIAFLSERLDLNPTEAQKFWPEYNAYIDEIEEVKKSMKRNHNKEDVIDDSTAEKLLKNGVELEEKLLSIKKKYISTMKLSIGAKKTLTFFHFERKFKERLLKSVKDRRKKYHKRGN